MTRLAVDRDGSIMRRDNVLNHRQAKTCARRLQRHLGARQAVELLEYSTLLVFGNPWTVVRYADGNLLPSLLRPAP